MPIWFYNRPLDKTDPTELKVAEVLNQLPDGWRIRWGYFYERKSAAGLRDKEGDFILLGPDGRILVMEVKEGQNRHFALTGEWEHDDDNPATQLFAEWDAIIADLNAGFEGRIPYVGKALCLPYVNLTEQDRLMGELTRECLIFRQDLDDFEKWWRTYMAPHPSQCKDPVKAFQSGLARGLRPESIRLFIKQSDRLFEQFKATEFEILSMLQNNRHWMVEGGVGTGKTFMALKQAEWLAEQGEGQRVLFLVYNLLLAERLKRMADRLKLRRGQVEVLSWEEFVAGLIAEEGLQLEIPKDPKAMAAYFRDELPEYVGMALESGRVEPIYDALVIDEAQDHDTSLDGKEELGWWNWYLARLREGIDAPIAIFYDQAQRPAFRGPEKFDPAALRQGLGGAVHVRLGKALRYTLPIFQYLKRLRSPGTAALVEPISAHEHLPAGMEVVERKAEATRTTDQVAEIINDWKSKGLCKPTDVALIGPRKWLKNSTLGEGASLCGFEVVDYDEEQFGKISYIGAHRSKGMDFLAVILIDFPAFSEFAEDSEKKDLQEGYFIAASRARQLLAVVKTI